MPPGHQPFNWHLILTRLYSPLRVVWASPMEKPKLPTLYAFIQCSKPISASGIIHIYNIYYPQIRKTPCTLWCTRKCLETLTHQAGVLVEIPQLRVGCSSLEHGEKGRLATTNRGCQWSTGSHLRWGNCFRAMDPLSPKLHMYICRYMHGLSGRYRTSIPMYLRLPNLESSWSYHPERSYARPWVTRVT